MDEIWRAVPDGTKIVLKPWRPLADLSARMRKLAKSWPKFGLHRRVRRLPSMVAELEQTAV
jgi:hypothetical protein